MLLNERGRLLSYMSEHSTGMETKVYEMLCALMFKLKCQCGKFRDVKEASEKCVWTLTADQHEIIVHRS